MFLALERKGERIKLTIPRLIDIEITNRKMNERTKKNELELFFRFNSCTDFWIEGEEELFSFSNRPKIIQKAIAKIKMGILQSRYICLQLTEEIKI